MMILYIVLSLFIALLIILFTPLIRLQVVKLLIKSFLKKPAKLMSETERDAIKCGDIYWEKNLFSNNLKWDKLCSIESPSLSPEESSFLAKNVPEICETFREHGLSKITINKIKEEGFWSLNIPKEYGGLDFSPKAHAKILTQLSSCSSTLAVTIMVPNSLGPSELILHYGTSEQKKILLPRLASGKEIPCFALTSKAAGSDASAMIDTGVICNRGYKGKKTLGLLLNWDKRYTTLAPIATIIGLAFKTFDPDGLIGNHEDLGITCALVDSSLPGISIGRIHHPMGSEFSNGPHSGKNVFIPMSAVIGGQDMLGKGWLMLMECLSLGRGVSLPSLSMSGVELSLKTSIEYSLIRRQFKKPLYSFEGVGENIAYMASDLLEMKAMSDFHLGLLTCGLNPSISSAILKYHHTESLRKNINRAMDIHGGKTVMLGNKNYLSDIYQAVPIGITVEGSNILTRSMIIFGQGLMRCHPFLMDEIDAMIQGDSRGLNGLIGRHLAHITGIKARSFTQALTNGYFVTRPKNAKKHINCYYGQLSSLSASFSFLVEMVLMRHRSKIKFQESINGLFSDLLIKMYGISSLLKYSSKLNDDFNELMSYTLKTRVYESQTIIKNISDQLMIPRMIKWVVLPKGMNFSKPSIPAQNRIVDQLINKIAMKSALTGNVLILKGSALEQLEAAYMLTLESESLCKRIGYACDPGEIDKLLDQQVISIDEHQILFKLIQIRSQVLEVNDYEN